MRGALLVLLAACGAEGILVEVRPPAGATSVELFLGAKPCTLGNEACARMQPPEADRPEAAEVYLRQPDVMVATVSGGAARFVLGSEDRTLPVAIAVAFAGDVPVGVGHIEELDLRRDPFHVILEQAPPAHPIWGDARARCAGVELTTGAIAFVVPEADTDCDAVAVECDPLAYRVARPSNRICAGELPAVSGPACMVGGVPCREDPAAPVPACLAGVEPFCVPRAVCACAAGDTDCMRDQLVDTGAPRVACTFAAIENPANATERIPCPSGAGAMPAPLDLGPLGFALKCSEAPELGPVALPVSLKGELQLAGQKLTERDFAAAPCAVSLAWDGVVTAQTPAQQDGLISLHVEAGARRRQVLLPLTVAFTGACDTPPVCVLANGADVDAVWNCAH